MIKELENIMRKNAQAIAQNIPTVRVGQVANYNANTHSVRLKMQPEDSLSGWIPVVSPYIGDGWGLFIPPIQNSQMLVIYYEGSYNSGFAVGGIFDLVNDPLPQSGPQPAQGEVWLNHSTGSYFHLKNDGNFYINGNIILTGSITATGDILDKSGTNVNNMRLMRSIYNTHTHGGVSAGSANTAVPNQTE